MRQTKLANEAFLVQVVADDFFHIPFVWFGGGGGGDGGDDGGGGGFCLFVCCRFCCCCCCLFVCFVFVLFCFFIEKTVNHWRQCSFCCCNSLTQKQLQNRCCARM